MQPRNGRQLPRSTSLAPGSRAEAFNAKSVVQPRREKTLKGGRMSANKHSVFVLGKDSKPLTPTTPTKARKLLAGGGATKCWSKFGTFGIQLTTVGRVETPDTALGVDGGTKFEGYSAVVGKENPLNIKLDLPNKKHIVRKLKERRIFRRARRHRNCRRRPARFDNRRRQRNWLAPSQAVIVGSRLKVIREYFRIYPINVVAFEDVRFNHAAKHWGANFSTVELGKTRIKDYFKFQGAVVFEYLGFETQEIRKRYGYSKTSIKNTDKFTAHCSDSLALAVDVVVEESIEPGPFFVVDDTYRCERRQLHYAQPTKGGIRREYSKGTVFGLRKGLLIGLPSGKTGRLCGKYKGGYRYYTIEGKRNFANQLAWVSSNFIIRKEQ